MKTFLTTAIFLGAILTFENTFSGAAFARGGGGHVGGGHAGGVHNFGEGRHEDQHLNHNNENRNWNNNYYGGYGNSFGVYGGGSCYTDQNGITTCD